MLTLTPTTGADLAAHVDERAARRGSRGRQVCCSRGNIGWQRGTTPAPPTGRPGRIYVAWAVAHSVMIKEQLHVVPDSACVTASAVATPPFLQPARSAGSTSPVPPDNRVVADYRVGRALRDSSVPRLRQPQQRCRASRIPAAWTWSVTDTAAFWAAVWDFLAIGEPRW